MQTLTISMYTLEDVEEMNRQYPDTFFIPSESERSDLPVGKYAKLIFVVGGWAERMWVKVTENKGGRYKGQLDNTALDPSLPERGSEIIFGKEHVADYL